MDCPKCKLKIPQWGYKSRLKCTGCLTHFAARDFEAGLLAVLLLWWLLSTITSVAGFYLLNSAMGFIIAHLLMLALVAIYLLPVCIDYQETEPEPEEEK